MDTDQAKLILQSYRPNGRDEDDPSMREALAMVEKDPELKAWFEEQRSLHASIGRKVRQAEVPADLMARIMEGRPDQEPKTITLWRRRLALAAMIVLFAGIATVSFWPSARTPEARFRNFQADMADFLSVFPRLDLETERLVEIQQWIQQKPSLASVTIPKGLHRFPAIGCRDIPWGDQTVAMVCFMVDGEVIHLFLLPHSAWPDTSGSQNPIYAKAGRMSTASWVRGDVVYLALTKGNESSLRKVL